MRPLGRAPPGWGSDRLPRAQIALETGDLQAQVADQSAADKAPDGVRLPLGYARDLGDGGAVGALPLADDLRPFWCPRARFKLRPTCDGSSQGLQAVEFHETSHHREKAQTGP